MKLDALATLPPPAAAADGFFNRPFSFANLCPGAGPRRFAGEYLHSNTAGSMPSMLDTLCFFMYFVLHAPQGRWPSHLVLRERHRSQEAQSELDSRPEPAMFHLNLIAVAVTVDKGSGVWDGLFGVYAIAHPTPWSLTCRFVLVVCFRRRYVERGIIYLSNDFKML